MLSYTQFSDVPQVFVASLPLFASSHGLLVFYLGEIWHRYLAYHLPLCKIDSDGTCIQRKENTGVRTTACCECYQYFSAEGQSSKKDKAGRDYATAILTSLQRSGGLASLNSPLTVSTLPFSGCGP